MKSKKLGANQTVKPKTNMMRLTPRPFQKSTPCKWFFVFSLAAYSFNGLANSTPETTKINKLLYMYRIYYLPFSIDFKEGRTVNDVLPFIADEKSRDKRLIQADELQSIDKVWDSIRAEWRTKSLLLNTQVPLGQSQRITNRLISHHIPVTRTWSDALTIPDRIQLAELLKSKPPLVQSAFKQLRFAKSFLGPADDVKFNFILFSAHWCESCREYRVLLETYFKDHPKPEVNLHSVLIEDPKEEIFDSKLIKELFPSTISYTHETIPKFIALENEKGVTRLWEEGEALKELYERFLKPHRGSMDKRIAFLSKKRAAASSDK